MKSMYLLSSFGGNFWGVGTYLSLRYIMGMYGTMGLKLRNFHCTSSFSGFCPTYKSTAICTVQDKIRESIIGKKETKMKSSVSL